MMDSCYIIPGVIIVLVLVISIVVAALTTKRKNTLLRNLMNELKDNSERIDRIWNILSPEIKEEPVYEVSLNDVELPADIFLEYPKESCKKSEHQKPPLEPFRIEDFEAALKDSYQTMNYKREFLFRPVDKFKTSEGKQVCIRLSQHKKIQDLLYFADCDCKTISGFIDNLLADHFSKNSEEINSIIQSGKSSQP